MKNKDTYFSQEFLYDNMMGPNCVLILEELMQKLQIDSSMRILDLGCGTGLTSIYLAKKYKAQIFATDLWINPTENFKRFCTFGVENQIVPIHAEAHELPYPEDYFDAVISIDSYHYYGHETNYLDKHLVPLLKPDGVIAIAIPGLQKDLGNSIPTALQPFWQENMNFYSCTWWKNLWEQSINVDVQEIYSLYCHEQAWKDWLACNNPYAVSDREMMKAEKGEYFNTIGIIAKRKRAPA